MSGDLSGVKVNLVETTEDALAFVRWAGERRPLMAIDTETTGLKWWTPNFVRLVQFGDGETGWAMDAERWKGPSIEVIDRLRADGSPTVFHNAPFDLLALEVSGFGLPDLRTVHDTLVMDHLVDNRRPHGLKPVADRYYPGASAGQGLLNKTFRENGWWWDTVPTDHPHYWTYGALDCVLTARIAEHLWPLAAPYAAAYEREMAVRLILTRCVQRGMRVDVAHTEDLLTRWIDEAQALRADLDGYGLANPSSNRALAAALSNEGWEPKEWTVTGEAKVDRVVLAEVVRDLGIPAEIATRVIRYKRLLKWTQTYLVPFLEDRDGADRIHASVNTLAARTGRMSVTGPPLQTLPSSEASIRKCILPYEGHDLWAVDYAGQEARIFASVAGDVRQQDIIRRGDDLYTEIAKSVYDDETITKADPRRQVSKTVFLAGIYGAGKAKMAATAGVTEAEIDRFKVAYSLAYPEAAGFPDVMEQVARQRMVQEGVPYIITSGGRRVASVPDKTYALTNYLCQGSGADVVKQAIVNLDAVGLGDNIVMVIHDEILFSFEEGEAGAEQARAAASIMEDHTSFAVPITTEITGPLTSWGQAYEGKG